MIFSLLYLIVLARAIWRSMEERWTAGIVAGAMRVLLLFAAIALAWQHVSVFTMGGVSLTRTPATGSAAAALAMLAIQVLGPALSCVVLAVAYRRYRDVPAKDEAKARRPFSAWLPVGVLDVVYLFIAILAVAFTGDGFGPSE